MGETEKKEDFGLLKRGHRAGDGGSSPMGLVLRSLCGEGARGDGPVEVMTRLSDFNVVEVQGPQGPMPAPANSLVAFTAQAFRELLDGRGRGHDVWEFRVRQSTPAGPTTALLYIAAKDIFLIRAPSKVAL
jgi:hypothetical protein